MDRAEKRFGKEKEPAATAKAEIQADDKSPKKEIDKPGQTTPLEQMTSTPTSSAPEDIAEIASRHIKEREQNYARHERERSEMHKRHEKDFKDLSARHAEELAPQVEGE